METTEGGVSFVYGCFMTNEEAVKNFYPGAFIEDNIDTGVFSIRLPEFEQIKCDECGAIHTHHKPATQCRVIGTGSSYEAAWADAAKNLKI